MNHEPHKLTLRERFCLVVAIWLVFAIIDVWVVVHHWVTASIFVGFLGYTGCFSLAHKLITGDWPPWKKVWRLFRGEDI